ncbi:DUF3152 domain-containing protein [Streptomyces sp. NPDC004838]
MPAALLCGGALIWGALTLLTPSADRPVSGQGHAGPASAEPEAPAPTGSASAPSSAAASDRPRQSGEPRPPAYLENGPGTYTWARGTGRRAGTEGRLVRYGVKLEDGTGLDVDDVAAEIDGILRDRRGWTRQGVASFQRVASPPYDMLVHVVSPGTTDRLCGAWNLDTGGQVNCAKAPDLVVNVRRWIELSEQYRGRAHDYHALIINHEAGHVLGYGHRGCPGPGEPAPAMMQQIKGLEGCRANPWVYDEDGRLIDGPPVP